MFSINISTLEYYIEINTNHVARNVINIPDRLPAKFISIELLEISFIK